MSRRLHPSGQKEIAAWHAWYDNIYRRLGERAMESGRPGERLPELLLHDIVGDEQQLSQSWQNQPALLVTMSLTCGRTRQHARALCRLARRFSEKVNTVIIYVVEAHPTDVPSPYTDEIWLTPMNEIAGIHCHQPRTLEERIALAQELRRRFRLPVSLLVDAMDDRTWRAFGCAPNVGILADCEGRIVAKQGWFEPQEMARAIVALCGS